MAAIQDDKLFIADFGHVFINKDLNAKWIDLDKFKFGDQSTYGGWTWLGDTSGENVVEFESEGGEVEFKRTWDRKKAKSKRSDREITGTINSVRITKETFETAFPAGKWNEASKSYTAQDKVVETTAKLMLIMEDGNVLDAFGFYKSTLAGDMPKFDVENFTEIPLKMAALANDSLELFEIWEPRKVTPAAAPAAVVPGATG